MNQYLEITFVFCVFYLMHKKSEKSRFVKKKSDLFCFAETWYSQIFNTNESPVSECTQCGSLPTPSCQGSSFPLSACNHNAFRSTGDAATLNLKTVLLHKSGCSVIVLYFETNDEKKQLNPAC